MKYSRDSLLDLLAEDRAREVGDAIAAKLSATERAIWATGVLARLLEFVDAPDEARELLRVAADTHRWNEAGQLFLAVRDRTLIAERDDEEGSIYVLLVAEGAAKLLANASGRGRFDPDVAGWIAASAWEVAKRQRSSEARDVIRDSLVALAEANDRPEAP